MDLLGANGGGMAAGIKALITRLDAGTFAVLMGKLVVAEAKRLGVAVQDIIVSEALTEPDKGLDARVRNVAIPPGGGRRTFLWEGSNGFQFKTTNVKNAGSLGLKAELARPGPSALLRDGGIYVLCWNKDLNPGQREDVEATLRDAAREELRSHGLASEPFTAVFDAESIAQMIDAFPETAVELGIPDFAQALSLDELRVRLRVGERPFESDDGRRAAIELIRARVAGQDNRSPLLLTIHGDPGVGKTRLALEALDAAPTSVLYVSGPENLRTLASTFARQKESNGILIADEIDESDLMEVEKRLSGADGRWKVVAIRSRLTSRWQPNGGRSLLLGHLDTAATQRLITTASGLPERLATRIAQVADGFPELAFRLAEELAVDPDLDLVRLSRMDSPQEILKRALSDEAARRHLGPIALFSSVGVDGDVAYQLDEIATAFDLDPGEMRRHCEREEGRFVSRAGRMRQISPLLVAVWLATEVIENADVLSRVALLPDVLQTAFAEQLEYLGPSTPYLPRAVARVLDDNRFRRVEDFSEAAARFLRAAAAIAPEQVATAIAELVTSASDDAVRSIPRRDLVWALEILLWWPATWALSVETLLRFATLETETWGNNATNEFADSFAIFLSGSTVPYFDRAHWLQGKIERGNATELEVLTKAALAGLRSSNSRSSVGFRGGGEPTDWRPRSRDEYRDALGVAFAVVLAAVDRGSETARASNVPLLSHDLRWLIDEGLSEPVERELGRRNWTESERASLASGVRRALQFGEYDEPTKARVQAIHDRLMGRGLTEQLRTILRTPLWELEVNPEHDYGAPPLLVHSAARLLAVGDGLEILLTEGRNLPDQATRYALARAIARALGVVQVGDAGYARLDWVIVRAALSLADELGHAAWATNLLERTASDQPEELTGLLDYVDLTPTRLDLVVGAVEAGRAPVQPLANLMLGARAKQLDEAVLMRVLRLLRSAGSPGAALALLDQWSDDRQESPEPVRALAVEVALDAVRLPAQTMTEHHLERLVARRVISGNEVIAILEARVGERSGLSNRLDDQLIAAALDNHAEELLTFALRLIEEGPRTSSLYRSADLQLLSRTAGALGGDRVWRSLTEFSDRKLRWALHHMNWGGDQPEELVRQFLVSERLEQLRDEAAVCFSNSLGIVTGPMHRAIAREVERARSWAKALAGTPAVGWAENLATSNEREQQWMAEREAEEDARFGR